MKLLQIVHNQIERIKFDQPVAFSCVQEKQTLCVKEVSRRAGFIVTIYRCNAKNKPIVFTGEKGDQVFREFLAKRMRQLKQRAGVAV